MILVNHHENNCMWRVSRVPGITMVQYNCCLISVIVCTRLLYYKSQYYNNSYVIIGYHPQKYFINQQSSFSSIVLAMVLQSTSSVLSAVHSACQDGLVPDSSQASTTSSRHFFISFGWLASISRILLLGRSRANPRCLHSSITSTSSVSTLKRSVFIFTMRYLQY